jgi:hypothetical protein
MKTLCPHCRRETYASIPDNASDGRMDASCCRGVAISGAIDCATFTAGRRAGLKEALKLVRDWWVKSEPPMGLEIFDRLREAMKPARAKA